MGLDMCLMKYKKIYVNGSDEPLTTNQMDSISAWCNYQENLKNGGTYTWEEWTSLSEYLPDMNIVNAVLNNEEYTNSLEPLEVGYWRKANAIHNWFVCMVQNFEDDCCYHREITVEDLEELASLCHKCILAFNEADIDYITENLPTTEGFFFGSTEYDAYYIAQLEKTIDICQYAIDNVDWENEMVFYISSW